LTSEEWKKHGEYAADNRHEWSHWYRLSIESLNVWSNTIQDLFPAFADSSGFRQLLTGRPEDRCPGPEDQVHLSAAEVFEDFVVGGSLADHRDSLLKHVLDKHQLCWIVPADPEDLFPIQTHIVHPCSTGKRIPDPFFLSGGGPRPP